MELEPKIGLRKEMMEEKYLRSLIEEANINLTPDILNGLLHLGYVEYEYFQMGRKLSRVHYSLPREILYLIKLSTRFLAAPMIQRLKLKRLIKKSRKTDKPLLVYLKCYDIPKSYAWPSELPKYAVGVATNKSKKRIESIIDSGLVPYLGFRDFEKRENDLLLAVLCLEYLKKELSSKDIKIEEARIYESDFGEYSEILRN